jgi:hypothetical protein
MAMISQFLKRFLEISGKFDNSGVALSSVSEHASLLEQKCRVTI